MSSPSNVILPLVDGSVPASTAMKVDLPAPFGPMSPVILPRGISSETPSTARIPSKCRWTSSATSIGRSACSATVQPFRREILREHAAWLGPHALRPEPQKADDQKADRDPLERGHEADLRRDRKRAERELVRDEPGHLLETDRDEQRAEDRAQVVAAASDDHRREQDDRLRVQPDRWRPQGDEADEDCARESRDRTADDEDRHLERDGVLAERAGGQLVVAHGAKAAAERRVRDPRRDEPHERDGDDRERDVEVLVAVGVRVDLVLERLRHERQPRGTVEERARVGDDLVCDDREHQQGDRLVVRPKLTEDHETDGNSEKRAHRRSAEPRDGEGQLIAAEVDLEVVTARGVRRHREHRSGVSPGGLENDEAEVDDAGYAELQVERDARDDVDARVHEKVRGVVRVHPAAAIAPRRASRPCGRRTMTSTSRPNATTSL